MERSRPRRLRPTGHNPWRNPLRAPISGDPLDSNASNDYNLKVENRNSRNGRLGWKVALIYFFMNVVLVALFIFAIYVSQGDLISRNTRYEAQATVSGLVQQMRRITAMPSSPEGYTADDKARIAKQLSQIMADSLPHHLIFDKSGILQGNDPGLKLPAEALGEAQRARMLHEQAGSDYILQPDFQSDILRFYIPLDDFGLSGATALLESDFNAVHQLFRQFYLLIILTGVVISVLNILFALLLHRMVVRPIGMLTKAAGNIADGNYGKVLADDRTDEIGLLAYTFNSMTEKIRYQIEALHNKNEELSLANHKIREMAVTDELTGLYNRHHLHNAMATTLQTSDRYGRPLGLLLLDVDHFKKVNDTYGHTAGDIVLRHIAAILKRTVRQSDLVARYGGEEMVVVLPETDIKGSVITAEKIRVIIANTPISIGNDQTLRVSVSIGVAEFQDLRLERDLSPDIGDLINAADEALYRAKENGRNCVLVHEPQEEE